MNKKTQTLAEMYTKDQLGRWWCILNDKMYPQDFPLNMNQEEAWNWIQLNISWDDAKPYWLEFINKRRVK